MRIPVVRAMAGAVAIRHTVGVGAFAFRKAERTRDLDDDPAACSDRHGVRTPVEGRSWASHQATAAGSSLPWTSRRLGQGAEQSPERRGPTLAFAAGDCHEPIAIKGANRAAIDAARAVQRPAADLEPVACQRRSSDMGHERVPAATVALLPPGKGTLGDRAASVPGIP